jgi:hypothetical protein
LRSLKDDLEALMAIGVVTEKGEIAPEFSIETTRDTKLIQDAIKLKELFEFYERYKTIQISLSLAPEHVQTLLTILIEFINIKEAEIARKSLHE